MTGRSCLLFSICIFLLSYARAQDKKVALGLGFSPTINWMKTNSENLDGAGSRVGYTYGLIADFNFGENYAFATGIYINNGGGKVKSVQLRDSLPQEVTTTYKLQFLQIPLTLRMRTKEIGYLRYYGQFGFNPELVIGAKGDVDETGEETRKNVNEMSQVVDLNLSLVLGVGVMYNLSGTTNFIIGLSYHNGFIDMLKGSSGTTNAVDKRASTNQIALNLGVQF